MSDKITTWMTRLSDEHRRELLKGSAIDPEVIVERGYRSAMRPSNTSTDIRDELKAARIPTWAIKEDWYFPGLIIPWYRATGERTQLQFKPRSPVPNKDGKRMKYASAKGCTSLLDVHPRWSRDRGQDDPSLVPFIRDVNTPLHITEGIKKADSLTSRGLCTVGLNGVYNWRNSLGTLGDWEDIPLKGRTVVVVYDADATKNRAVLQAMTRIGKWLRSKGAKRVQFAIPPEKLNGTETKGIDDYFAAGGQWSDIELRSTPPTQQIIGVDRFTDAGLSEEVAAEALEDRFCFTTAMGWMRYNGIRWVMVDPDEPEEAIRQYVRAEYLAAIDRKREAVERDDQKAMDRAQADEAGWHKYQAANRLSSLLKLAKGIDGVKKDARDFDQDPDVLNTPDGLLHLDTLHTEPHSPDHMCTKVTAVSYRPGAEHPAFKQALMAVPDGADEWLQVHLGQAATGHSTDRFVMCSGGGANGKTALMSTFYRALGGRLRDGAGYTTLVKNKLLLGAEAAGAATPERMDLRALRFAYIEETPEDKYLDTQALKELVDVPAIKGRYLFKDLVEWEPSHSLFLNTNHPPQVTQTDHGTWRRLVNIVFPYRFRSENDSYGPWVEGDLTGDAGIKNKLKTTEALEAALAWMVEGAHAWYQGGMTFEQWPDPECVVEATKTWRHDSDTILRFLDRECVFDLDSWVSSRELYEEFRGFSETTGVGKASEVVFKKRLMGHTGLPSKIGAARRVVGSEGYSTNHIEAPGGGSWAGATGPVKGKQVMAVTGLRFKRPDE